MREVLQLVTIFGVFYLAVLIGIYSNPVSRNRFAERYNAAALLDKFESKRFKEVFKGASISASTKHINLARYGSGAGYIILDFMFRYVSGSPFSPISILIIAALLLFTEPLPFTPISFLMKQLKRRYHIKKDSELIGFIKLYENNRSRSNPVQLYVFCRRVSSHFQYIRRQLLDLSERIVDHDVETSLDWWAKQYPADHPFIGQIRTIILTTESMAGAEAVEYLKSQGEFLTKLSSDQYRKRGMLVGDLAKIINGIPSILTFAMVIAFVFMYVMIVRQQVSIIN